MSFLILVSHVSADFNCPDMLDRLILIERWIQNAQQAIQACRSNRHQEWICLLHSDLMNLCVCVCLIPYAQFQLIFRYCMCFGFWGKNPLIGQTEISRNLFKSTFIT